MAIIHEVQKQVLKDLQLFLPQSWSIECFSDGCSSQYKNRNNFLNLCYHARDCNLMAKWSFFATSHGKQPCDEIGGTMKRLAAKASFQKTTSKQISMTTDLVEFCRGNTMTESFLYAERKLLMRKWASLKDFKELVQCQEPGNFTSLSQKVSTQ